MEAEINKETLERVVKEVETINPAAVSAGLMAREIKQRGFYEEGALRFEHEDFKVGQLYAGLAVLARDMYQYLSQNPRDDAALFQEVISLVNAEERETHGDQAFPNYEGLPVDDLPQQLASVAALGQPAVSALGSRNIMHEWTLKPGKRLFVKFGSKFKETICGKDGPYEQFNKGLLKLAALPTTIAYQILIAGFSPATFWYPLAVYVGYLLVKTGLKTYCEPD